MAIYVYPKLPAKFECIYRFFGAGLGNCLFVYSRALILHKRHKATIIRPAWEQFKMGPFLRGENDNRLYNQIFDNSEVSGIHKFRILITHQIINEEDFNEDVDELVIKIEGIKNFFEPLYGYNEYIKKTLLKKMNQNLAFDYKRKKKLLSNNVALHIRRGDYPSKLVSGNTWFLSIIKTIKKIKPSQKFLVFSDASADGLKSILQFPNVEYLNTGNALVDMLLLSESKLIIGSNSTFSGWGAFLGSKPIIMEHRYFPPIHGDSGKELIVENENSEALENFCRRFL